MIEKLLSQSLNIPVGQVMATVKLLSEGATIPFISRYRKEATGNLDEVAVGAISEQYDKLMELQKRKATILKSIEEQGKLTDELRMSIENCWISNDLEDIYLPYKPKRQTRAHIARQKGLEPLAEVIYLQRNDAFDVSQFLNDSVANEKEALDGAMDIIAEWLNENQEVRNIVRGSFRATGEINSAVVKGKEAEGDKYRDLFDYSIKLSRCPSHRLLAMRRGESEGVLRVSISPDSEGCVERVERKVVRSRGRAGELVSQAALDAFKRLLKPSIETEFAAESKERADIEAIGVFTDNLRQLLMSSPIGQKRTMGIDPGFRTGCKVVCLDAQGALLFNDAIYPHEPQREGVKSAGVIRNLIEKYKIEVVAIGDGTASRETEDFMRGVLQGSGVELFLVSENGASIYSASKVARDEFPDYDITVRGSVSIARRLMDPLAELVKIDAKSLGVGQYQHDVDQKALKRALDTVVESCVNQVGVDINTASKHLLAYVSGIGDTLAQNIVDYRSENGAFGSRKEIKKVARMGEKAFEQCAGFLRISAGDNPLDNSAVHPESYAVVERMSRDLGCTVGELIASKELKKSLVLDKYVSDKVGMPTLNDIMSELEKPGRDPRGEASAFEFDASVRTIGDLREGMILPGIVGNITNFGCFVNIGIKENGLVHLSQLADKYVTSASEVVKLHQKVMVRVGEVDMERKRVALIMKGVPQNG